MSQTRKVTRNLLFKTLTEGAGRLLSLLFYVALARWLGEEPFGVYSILYSVAAIAVFLADPGLNTALIRQAPRDKEHLDETAGAILGLKLLLSAGVVGLCVGYGALAGYDLKMGALMALMGAQMAGFAVMEYAGAVFQAREQMHLETWVMSAGKFGVTILAIVALAAGGGLGVVLTVMAVAQGVAAAWALYWTGRQGVKLTLRFDPARWGKLLKDSVPLAAVTFFTLMFYRIDIPLAPFLGVGMADVGYYSAGVKILDVWLAAPTLAVSAVFPTLSAFAAAERGTFVKWTNRLLIALGLAGAVGAGVISAFSEELITFIFSARFIPAAGPLYWLMGASVFMFVRHGLLYALILDGRQGRAVGLAAAAVGVNVTLNAFLATNWGITGMAAAKLLSDAALMAGAGYFWIIRMRGKSDGNAAVA
ncbi:MAG: oligosaccharide flippase family protein [Nitrospinae bacterium]|nr:oligosaccharide flippase family protein [Nitrospinota bacterium]